MAETLRKYALPFAAWELRLYLDTHPDDCQALALYQYVNTYAGDCNYANICREKSGGGEESVLAYLDRAACADSGNVSELLEEIGTICGGDCEETSCPVYWTWIEGPWPWENCRCRGESEA